MLALIMNDSEFNTLVARERAGSVLVGIDQTVARQFFTDLSFKDLELRTGETLYVEKSVVVTAQITGPLLLLVSMAFAPLAFGWWSVLAIPVFIAIYFFVMSLSSLGSSNATFPAFLLGLAVFAHVAGWFPTSRIGWCVTLATAALFCGRLVYVAATIFMRSLVLRNQRAFELLVPHLQIRAVQ